MNIIFIDLDGTLNVSPHRETIMPCGRTAYEVFRGHKSFDGWWGRPESLSMGATPLMASIEGIRGILKAFRPELVVLLTARPKAISHLVIPIANEIAKFAGFSFSEYIFSKHGEKPMNIESFISTLDMAAIEAVVWLDDREHEKECFHKWVSGNKTPYDRVFAQAPDFKKIYIA